MNDRSTATAGRAGYLNRSRQYESRDGGCWRGVDQNRLGLRDDGQNTTEERRRLDFGSKKLTWTIDVNGLQASVPMHLDPNWVIEPFEDAGSKNRPPTLQLEPAATPFEGPPVTLAASFSAGAGEALTLTVYATDVKPATNLGVRARSAARERLDLSWSKFRGPGTIACGSAGRGSDVGRKHAIPDTRQPFGLGRAVRWRWVVATLPGPPARLFLLPTGSGETRSIPADRFEFVRAATWFPDGERLLLATAEPGQGLRLFVQPLDGGAEPITPGVSTSMG